MDKLFTIKDRVAVITGATGVLWRKWREMARRGARVVVMSIARGRADNLTENQEQGGTALGCVDVLDKDSLIRARTNVETFDELISDKRCRRQSESATVSPISADIPAMPAVGVQPNVLGIVLATQVFEVMVSRARKHNQYFLHELYRPYQYYSLFGRQGKHQQFYPMDGCYFNHNYSADIVSMQLLRASSIR